ncbi:MAG: gliding motility-associated C-terminal domain-containing protein, partial [Bacteroidetes bacterium]|nr:gliding motility-associated C-terminal domain-containing protein [Bacteroidota bacterium]
KEYHILFLAGAKWTVVDTVLAIDTHLIRIPVACNTTVYYRIAAVDSFGNEAFSDTAGGQAIDIILPNPPKINNATVLTGIASQIKFRGSDSLDMYSYAIQRGTNGSYSTAGSILFTTPGATHTFKDNVNTLNDYHSYVVIALDSCLNAAPSDTFNTYQLMGAAQQLGNRISWKPFKGYAIDSNIVQVFKGGTWKQLVALKSTDSFYVHSPLPCGQTTTYRIFAKAKVGLNTTLSDTITLTPFDTVRPTPVVIDYATVKGFSIYLSWQKSSADVKTYDVEMKTSGGIWKKIATTTNLFTTATFLNTRDSTYSFRVFAYDTCAANKSLPGKVHTVVQLAGVAKNLSNDLSWSAYVGFASVGKYIIYHNVGGVWSKLDSVSGSTLSYINKPLACNVKQYYKIVTVDNLGKFLSHSDSVGLTPFDTIKPAAPSLNYVSVVNTKKMKVAFNWNPASDVKYYDVYRQANGLGAYVKVKTVTYDSTFTDTVSDAHTNKYSYYTIAVDSCSSLNRSLPSDTDMTMIAKTYTGGCKPYVTIYWNPYVELTKIVDNYVIWRSTSGKAFTPIKTLSATSVFYTDSTVLEDTGYCYRIQAIDKQTGFSSFSDTFCATPFIYPRPKTITMQRVTVTKSSATNGEISVEWNRLIKGDTFAIAYRVYHSTSLNGTYSLVKQENDTNVTSFKHSGINTTSAEHYYYVVTVNKCNLEAFITPGDTHKAVLLTITNNNLSVDLKWTNYLGYKIARYEIYKSVNKSAYGKLADMIPTDSVFTDTKIRCNQTYSYKIVAVEVGSFGRRSNSDTITINGMDTIPPTKAKVIMASVLTTSKTVGEITLQFTASTETNRKGYKLYRSINGGTDFLIATVNDTNYNITIKDNKLNTKDNTYGYYVQTFDSCANTAVSSDTHTVNSLKALATNGKNTLSWSGYKGWQNFIYIVQRRSPSTGWNTLDTLTAADGSYDDSLTTCHVTYTYKIATVDIGSGSISYSNEDTATAFESNPPQMAVLKNVTVVNSGMKKGVININWTTSHSRDLANYIIMRKPENSKFWQVATMLKDTTYNDSNLNTMKIAYQYKIITIDSCGNRNFNIMDVHRSMVLDVTAGNSEMDLIWNKYAGFPVAKYVLYKDGIRYQDFANTDTTYIDTMVICAANYKYNVVALSSNDTLLTSSSNIDSALTIDHKRPRPVYLSTASVDTPNSVILLRWKKSENYDGLGYRIYRRDGEIGTPILIDSTHILSDTFYYDRPKDIGSHHYCYEVYVIDYCFNVSNPSNKGCIMHTKGKPESLKNTVYWIPYKDWRWGIDHYNIYKRNDSAQWKQIGTVNSTTLTFTDETLDDTVKDFCYRIEAIEKDGTKASSFSTEICLQQPAIIYMPNAFSPNTSPDLNDKFGPGGAYFAKYEMKIFNRWGEMIYQTSEGKPWDGTFKNISVPEGVYVYKVKVTGYDQKDYIFQGVLNLLK